MKNRQKQISSNESDIKSLSIFQSFHLYFLNNQKINAKLNAAISKLSYKQLLNFLIIGIEIFCSIGLLAFLANKEHIPLLIAPFGATAALIYGTPKSKMAKLRNVLAGHIYADNKYNAPSRRCNSRFMCNQPKKLSFFVNAFRYGAFGADTNILCRKFTALYLKNLLNT